MGTKECLGIVGVGLIGGSIGLAARRTSRFAMILGVDRNPTILQQARAHGCIDDHADLDTVAQQSDVLVVCAPVDRIAHLVLKAIPSSRVGALLTDVGSTKQTIVESVNAFAHPSVGFVGAHPLAGSEKRGPEHARADLFDNRMTILTPTDRTSSETLAMAQTFWKSLGCQVATMTPEEHDRTLAFTSHLPHLASAALAGTLLPEWHPYCASGFRDMTRLAGGDPDLWAAILTHNRDNVASALDRLQVRLNEFRAALQIDNYNWVYKDIHRLLAEAKKVRDDLGN